MVEVAFSSSFQRAFKRKVAGLAEREARFWERLEWFKTDPFDPRLKTPKRSGKLKDRWSFSLEYDLRVIFSFVDDQRVLLVDIGTHREVY